MFFLKVFKRCVQRKIERENFKIAVIAVMTVLAVIDVKTVIIVVTHHFK